MTAEHITQMAPMLVLAGLTIGWGAEAVRHVGGHGFLVDLAVAVVASLVGGLIVWSGISTNVGMLAMFGFGCVSAALAIAAQRTVWPSAPSAA